MEVNNSVLASLSTPPCVHEWQYDGSQYITCNQNAGTQSMMMMMVCVCVCVCAHAHACVCVWLQHFFFPYFINGHLQIQISNYLHFPVLYYNVTKL